MEKIKPFAWAKVLILLALATAVSAAEQVEPSFIKYGVPIQGHVAATVLDINPSAGLKVGDRINLLFLWKRIPPYDAKEMHHIINGQFIYEIEIVNAATKVVIPKTLAGRSDLFFETRRGFDGPPSAEWLPRWDPKWQANLATWNLSRFYDLSLAGKYLIRIRPVDRHQIPLPAVTEYEITLSEP